MKLFLASIKISGWKVSHKSTKELINSMYFRNQHLRKEEYLIQHNKRFFQITTFSRSRQMNLATLLNRRFNLFFKDIIWKKGSIMIRHSLLAHTLKVSRCSLLLPHKKAGKLTHADVSNACLNGEIEKLIFTHLSLHWNKINGDSLGKDGNVVVLHKALYKTPNARKV